MPSVKTLVTASALAAAISTDHISAWKGSATFFDGPVFTGDSLTVNFGATERCYDIGCFNDRASSVRWQNLPEGYIVFYSNKDCLGRSRFWRTTTPYFPSNLELDKFDNVISSFLYTPNSVHTKKSQYTVCPFGAREALGGASNITVDDAFAVEMAPSEASETLLIPEN